MTEYATSPITDGELLGVVLFVLTPLALALLWQTLRDRKRRTGPVTTPRTVRAIHPRCRDFGHHYIPAGKYWVCGVCDDAVARLVVENPDDVELWEQELAGGDAA